jgi:hypothetical protein
MQLELGNADPILPDGETRDAPCVTYVTIPDDPDNFPEGHHAYQQVEGSGMNGATLRAHLSEKMLEDDGRITHLPGHEAVICVASPFGIWRSHAKPGTKPTWIDGDNAETVRILADYYGCPIGRPADVEDTHHTLSGAPGDGPPVDTTGAVDLQANISQNGRDMQSKMFGGGGKFDSGVATTAPTATTVTLDGKAAPGSTTAYQGQRIAIGSTAVGVVWGNCGTNTNAAPPVITVDRWYNAATPGGVAATTPLAGPWITLDGVAPSWFMGLSASVVALGTPSTNTSLPGEIVTAGGGLVRQQCPWAHTASAATTTLTPVFVANGTDVLPVTLGSVGTFNSMVVAFFPQSMFFNTLFSSTATLSSVGDQLTVTQTITGT